MTSLSDPTRTATEHALNEAIAELMRRASAVRDHLIVAPPADTADTQAVVARLTNSVVRPLEAALRPEADQPAGAASDQPARSWADRRHPPA